MTDAPHAAARRALSAALRAGRLPRTLLITGEDGVGKADFAAWLARRRWCEAEDAPCDACPTCRKLLTGNHPDHLVVRRGADAASGAGSKHEITVDQVRQEILSMLAVRAVEGRGRTVVVEGAEDLNVEAQNALLKTLEEPPPESLLVLVTAREEALLDTIRSRCQEIRLFPAAGDVHPLLRPDGPRAALVQGLGPERVFEALDLLLQGQSDPARFSKRLQELTGEVEAEESEAVRAALELLQLRLRDHALAGAGGRDDQRVTAADVDVAALPPPEALLQAHGAVLEAVQDGRRHLPAHVSWLALGREIARARVGGAPPADRQI